MNGRGETLFDAFADDAQVSAAVLAPGLDARPPDVRIRRALEALRPSLQVPGVDVIQSEVRDRVARLVGASAVTASSGRPGRRAVRSAASGVRTLRRFVAPKEERCDFRRAGVRQDRVRTTQPVSALDRWFDDLDTRSRHNQTQGDRASDKRMADA